MYKIPHTMKESRCFMWWLNKNLGLSGICAPAFWFLFKLWVFKNPFLVFGSSCPLKKPKARQEERVFFSNILEDNVNKWVLISKYFSMSLWQRVNPRPWWWFCTIQQRMFYLSFFSHSTGFQEWCLSKMLITADSESFMFSCTLVSV